MPANRKSKTVRAKRELAENSPQSNLAVEAHHLRVLIRRISSHFVNDLESEVVRMIELAGDVPEGPKKEAAVESMIQNIQNLQVKPHKGRMRDLKRIRNQVRECNQRLDDLV